MKAFCIAEKIEGAQGKELPITLEQAKQIITLIKETGIGDLKWRNFIHCENGQLAFIDTESFEGQKYGFHSFKEKNTFTPEAEQYLNEEMQSVSSFKRSP